MILIQRFFGGHGRIRTAVRGFADRCLATRPRDRFYSDSKNRNYFHNTQIFY